MKAILLAALFAAELFAETPLPDHAAHPKACDDLKGQEKEACLKQGGTVKASTAAGGSSAPKAPAKKAKKDYPKRDSK
jgi:hypothetical protein